MNRVIQGQISALLLMGAVICGQAIGWFVNQNDEHRRRLALDAEYESQLAESEADAKQWREDAAREKDLLNRIAQVVDRLETSQSTCRCGAECACPAGSCCKGTK